MTTADPQFEGVYGPYSITETDRRDVQRYRLALLTTGLARFHALAGVDDTCDASAWRHDYFGALFPLNPGGIVPAGPDLSTLVSAGTPRP